MWNIGKGGMYQQQINISLCRGLHLIKISDNKNNNFKNYKIFIQ